MKFHSGAVCCLLAVCLTAFPARSGGKKNLIVSLKNGYSLENIHRKYRTRTVRQIRNSNTYLIEAPDTTNATLPGLRKEDVVADAEEDSGFSLESAAIPAGVLSLADLAMAFLADVTTMTTFEGTNVLRAYAGQPALALTQADQVRGISTGAGTKVAYIDTGVDPTHPALGPWLDPGVDLVNNQTSSEFDGLSQSMASLLDQSMASLLDKRFFFLLDQSMASLLDGSGGAQSLPPAFGHGTMVAGMIHAVAPEARLIPIKAFDAYGFTTTFTITSAVYEAISLGADVVNMSFSTKQHSDALKHAIDAAKHAGISVVVSVGNNESDAVSFYPAAYGNVWGVAATDLQDHLAGFSDYGGHVAVTAPGAFVVSTAPGGHYAAAWGTSFSAPMVAGAIAVLKSVKPNEKDGQSVVNRADNIDKLNPGFGGKLGHGRINLKSALTQ
jgi:subtilisin family serine protease